jgi:hypothetical protein
MHEIYIIALDDSHALDLYGVLRIKSRAQELVPQLGLVLLDVVASHLTVMNSALPGDQHLGLRARELARRLHRPVAEVRVETVRERRQRRARAEGLQCAQSARTRR